MKSTKNMLVAALVAGALIAGSSSVLAQDSNTNTPPAGEHHMKGGHPDFATALNLTDDQKPKFQEIMKNAMDKRKTLRDDTSLTPEDKKAKMKEIQDDMNDQLKALLTPDQYAKWEKMNKKGHHAPPAGAPPQN